MIDVKYNGKHLILEKNNVLAWHALKLSNTMEYTTSK